MIFLTVGGQLPFDRLVAALDEVAPRMNEPVFGQIGNTAYRPENFETVQFLTPEEFRERFSQARAVVAHAGIGTILSAKQARKPVILMPRRARFGEHRNDHQLATVAQLGHIEGVHIAQTAEEIFALLAQPELRPVDAGASVGRSVLTDFLRVQLKRAGGHIRGDSADGTRWIDG